MEALIRSTPTWSPALVTAEVNTHFSVVVGTVPTEAEGFELPNAVLKQQVTNFCRVSAPVSARKITLKYVYMEGTGNTHFSGAYYWGSICSMFGQNNISANGTWIPLKTQETYLASMLTDANKTSMTEVVPGMLEFCVLKWAAPINNVLVVAASGTRQVKIEVSPNGTDWTRVAESIGNATNYDTPDGTIYVRMLVPTSMSVGVVYNIIRVAGRYRDGEPVVSGYDDFEIVSSPTLFRKAGKAWYGCTRILCTHDINKANERLFVPRPLFYSGYATILSDKNIYESTNPVFVGEKK